MSPAPRRDRPQTRIQREKQDVILDAALNVFSLSGFRGATIDQIAEAAGMSKPNLLYYFPSIFQEFFQNRYAHGARQVVIGKGGTMQ